MRVNDRLILERGDNGAAGLRVLVLRDEVSGDAAIFAATRANVADQYARAEAAEAAGVALDVDGIRVPALAVPQFVTILGVLT